MLPLPKVNINLLKSMVGLIEFTDAWNYLRRTDILIILSAMMSNTSIPHIFLHRGLTHFC
jgi:hypothetical protein